MSLSARDLREGYTVPNPQKTLRRHFIQASQSSFSWTWHTVQRSTVKIFHVNEITFFTYLRFESIFLMYYWNELELEPALRVAYVCFEERTAWGLGEWVKVASKYFVASMYTKDLNSIKFVINVKILDNLSAELSFLTHDAQREYEF